jgi:HK97 gp10 family phage protein
MMDGWSLKATKETRSVLVKVPKHVKLHKKGIEQAHYDIGDEVVKRNRKLIKSGPKTGRIYRFSARKWKALGLGEPPAAKYRVHQASAPKEAPANLTGNLAKSADYKVHGWETMSVGQSAEYAEFLEFGTRRIKPRPNLIRAINEMAGVSLQAYKRSVEKYLK